MTAGAFLCLAILAAPALGQLHVLETKSCGETTCKQYEYCRDVDLICAKCSVVCDPSHHNFGIGICEKQCQDFLHDQRYERKSHSGNIEGDNFSRGDGSAKLIATVALIISLILLVLFLAISAYYLRNSNIWRNFKFSKEKKAPKSVFPDDCRVTTTRRPDDTTIKIPTISDAVQTTNPPPQKAYTHLRTFKDPAPKRPDSDTSNSPSSTNRSNPPVARRMPSEDSALDFAYDNPAMTPSPTSNKANNMVI